MNRISRGETTDGKEMRGGTEINGQGNKIRKGGKGRINEQTMERGK
jgi:hypothetical protein